VLAKYGIANGLGTFDFGSVPPGADGAYAAQQDLFLLNLGAGDQTIIHEGAHAEHYAAAGIVGNNFPNDPDTAVGALILSEAFVGFRLAAVSGFMAFEYSRLAKFGLPVVGVAQQFFSKLDAQGPPAAFGGSFVSGQVMTISLFRFLLLYLPIVVAESVIQQPRLTAGLSATSTHPSVRGTGTLYLGAVQNVLGLLSASGPSAVRSALTSTSNMQSVGASLMGGFRNAGVI
jgi:hypothetical protein